MYPLPAISRDIAQHILRRLPAHPVCRFAPSPTGYLHLGHLAHLLFVWGITKSLQGRVILRMEDHDRTRCTPAYERAILEDLEWLGFVPDAGHPEDFRAGASAYRQSDCATRYTRMLARLAGDGHVYGCACSRNGIKARTGQTDGEIRYDGHCRDLGLRMDAGTGIRFRIPGELVGFEDAWLGAIAQAPAKQCGDMLLKDRHGHWTYHFAVVCDDLEQGVNLVIRGQDLLDSTGRQILLGQALGRGTRPFYLHHPLIGDEAGQKLSKRDFGESLRDLRQAGKDPRELLGEAAWRVGMLDAPRALGPDALPTLFLP
ncbi:MAG: hypothetical protein HYV27_11780 [Candidatus Hydrogenedentes bacterium]|nr:hypothetical protein [Candidatus Hydrogenedentota bacterium]